MVWRNAGANEIAGHDQGVHVGGMGQSTCKKGRSSNLALFLFRRFSYEIHQITQNVIAPVGGKKLFKGFRGYNDRISKTSHEKNNPSAPDLLFPDAVVGVFRPRRSGRFHQCHPRLPATVRPC
jgi:hypothetical protein